MSKPFKREGQWVVEWKDGTDRWRQQRTKCKTKEQAWEYLRQLEQKGQAQRAGVEAGRKPSRATFGDVLDWYVEIHVAHLRSPSARQAIEKHLRPDLGELPLVEITSGRIERMLDTKTTLAAKSLNNLRAILSSIISRAMERELWHGTNPALAVKRRKISRPMPAYLTPDEVTRVLPEVPERWRGLFAAAVYTGLRRGELVALQKSDIDLQSQTITVARSWSANTTKGGRASMIPIHSELRPYLVAAMEKSTSALVFPRDDGSMHREHIDLPAILRSAMSRAGFVEGWVHKCRRCGKRVEDKTAERRKCPTDCGMTMWPSPRPRRIRFHDLRHTNATLLLKAGTPIAVVQRLLRHSSPTITSEIYGHLDVADMRAGLERLSFTPVAQTKIVPVIAIAANSGRGAAPVLRNSGDSENATSSMTKTFNDTAHFDEWVLQDSNLQPSGYEPVTRSLDGVASVHFASQPIGKTQTRSAHATPPRSTISTVSTRGAAPVLRNFRVVKPMLRVREVAALLSISTATVYAMLDRGDIERVWVGDSIRIPSESVDALISKGRDR